MLSRQSQRGSAWLRYHRKGCALLYDVGLPLKPVVVESSYLLSLYYRKGTNNRANEVDLSNISPSPEQSDARKWNKYDEVNISTMWSCWKLMNSQAKRSTQQYGDRTAPFTCITGGLTCSLRRSSQGEKEEPNGKQKCYKLAKSASALYPCSTLPPSFSRIKVSLVIRPLETPDNVE